MIAMPAFEKFQSEIDHHCAMTSFELFNHAVSILSTPLLVDGNIPSDRQSILCLQMRAVR